MPYSRWEKLESLLNQAELDAIAQTIDRNPEKMLEFVSSGDLKVGNFEKNLVTSAMAKLVAAKEAK